MRVLMITRELPTPERPNVWAPVARQVESIRSLGVSVDLIEVKGVRKLKYLKALRRMRSHLDGADLIHAHYGFCGWVGRIQLAKPLVVSFMGSDLLGTASADGRMTLTSRPVVALDRLLARSADAVIVKSPGMAQTLAPIQANVIPNGIDLDTFRPVDRRTARADLGWNSNRAYVLFPGSPANPRKAYGLAAEAVRHAAGAASAPLELVPLIDVPAHRVPTFMNACDALLMTSHWEGSPNAVKEAMACDLPVISVDVGDVADLLAGVESCEICPREPRALGDAVARVVASKNPSTGREKLREMHLDQESVARQVVDIYEDVLTVRGGRDSGAVRHS
jgi:glycosyltransferase involved in cell wall biosynthesis